MSTPAIPDDDPTDRGVTPRDALTHSCDDGWVETALEDRPRPCPRCKPHLTRTERHGFTAWRPAPADRRTR